MGTHFIDKEMNLERLRNLLKTTQLENRRVKNRSYFGSLVLSTTPYCRRTWLKSTDWLLSLSLLFFWTKLQVSDLKVQTPLSWSLYHSSQVSQSKELFCSLKIKQKTKTKNPQWIGGSPEEVSLKSSLSEANDGLRGHPSVSHSLLFGLCALGERVERTLGWVG